MKVFYERMGSSSLMAILNKEKKTLYLNASKLKAEDATSIMKDSYRRLKEREAKKNG